MTDSSEDEANSLDDLMMLAKLQASVVGETDVDLRVGRFEPKLERPLGEGTFSRVYEATDPQLERSVALKIYKKSSLEGLERQQVLEEARALAQLEHQNVVAIHEVGEHQGQIFLAMELVRGQTLEELHTTRPAWRTLVELYVQAGRGLAAAHGKGLVHGDFKPANVIVDEHGRPRVLDFGLARPHGNPLEGGATLELRVRQWPQPSR